MDEILRIDVGRIVDRAPATGDLVVLTKSKKIFIFSKNIKRLVPDVFILKKGSIFIVSGIGIYDEHRMVALKKLEIITEFGVQFIIYDELSKPFYVIDL